MKKRRKNDGEEIVAEDLGYNKKENHKEVEDNEEQKMK